MDLLYLIDRSITQILQYFSRKIQKWTKASPLVQSRLIFLVLVVGILTLFDLPPGYIGLLLAIVLYLSNYQHEYIVAMMLVHIHEFFDEDWLFSERLYEPGHLAWASILIGFSYTTLGYRLGQDDIQVAFTMNGVYMFSHGLWHFLVRGKGSNTRRKESISEALRKLLEKCKSWLPRRAPALG